MIRIKGFELAANILSAMWASSTPLPPLPECILAMGGYEIPRQCG
ncbi:hypothetical protein [Nitrosomonas sp.]